MDINTDPRMIVAREFRQNREITMKRQNRHMLKVFILSVIATTLIVFLSKLVSKMSGNGTLLANIIVLAGITILSVNGWALRYRQVKRNYLDEDEFWEKLDQMPKPEDA